MTIRTATLARAIRSVCVATSLAMTTLPGVLPHEAAAQDASEKKEPLREAPTGEVVYVPAYSHIYQGEKASRQPLSSTLAIHNVDPSKSINITSARYYDHAGTELRDYVDEPLTLGPLASASFVVDIKEDRGGVGANFIVEWQAEEKVVSPIIEAIMSGGTGTQGLSFVTRGKVISARP